MPTPIRTYLVCDLEATCWKTFQERGDQVQEVIEFGGVMLSRNGNTLRVIDEFAAFVKPTASTVSAFCTELTSITQEDVDHAKTWYDVSKDVSAWVRHHKCVVWGSWGDFDKLLIERESEFKSLRNPMPRSHQNIKMLMPLERGWKSSCGVSKALGKFDMVFEGSPHRALDDTRNIARMFIHHAKEVWK